MPLLSASGLARLLLGMWFIMHWRFVSVLVSVPHTGQTPDRLHATVMLTAAHTSYAVS